MSKKIIIIQSVDPTVQRRIDEATYVDPPWMNKAQKRYAEEVMRCRKDFQYWFNKYVVVKPKK